MSTPIGTPQEASIMAKAPASGNMERGLRRLRKSATQTFYLLATLAVLLLAWEAACHVFSIGAYLLPKPSDVIKTILDDPVFLLRHGLVTSMATLAGFVLATAVGILIAIVIVYSPFLEKTLFTALVAFNAIPKIAIAPLFIMWIGTGLESKVLMAFLIAIFPIIVDTVMGLRSIDPAQLDLVRTYRASQVQTFFKIRFPNALPSIFAGMKVGITLALIGTIVGEFVGANRGLGFVILQAQGTYQTPLVFAAIAMLSILGVILFNAIDLAERLALPWHVSNRGKRGK
jgi:NitT/TauT family transport system permease protein